MRLTLTPRWMFWMGVVLVVASLVLQAALLPALYAIGGQQLASNNFAWSLVGVSATVLLPLGAASVALSFIGRALEPVETDTDDPDADLQPWPRKVSTRVMFWFGAACVVIGLLLEALLPVWRSSPVRPDSLLVYVVAYVLPPLAAVAIPLGVILIPGAWVLRMIEARRTD